jgi:hypothetical protein
VTSLQAVPKKRVFDVTGQKEGTMTIKFNQYWDLAPGRKDQYAEFLQEEFLPVMKEMGVQVIAGWQVLVGEGPHIISEGIARDINHINAMLVSPTFRNMTARHLRFVRNFKSRVLVPSGRIEKTFAETPPEGLVKFNQAWNIRSSFEERYSEFFKRDLIPTFEGLGIEIAAEWNVLIGSGPFVIVEGHANSLETVAKALGASQYRLLLAQLEEWVEEYRSRILVRHRLFLEAIKEVYGIPIRAISESETSSMYGPLLDDDANDERGKK